MIVEFYNVLFINKVIGIFKSTEKLRKVKINSVSQFHCILLFGMMALKVSLEENCKEARERKSLRYADLMAKSKDKGWKLWLFQVEVAAKVFFF